MSIVYFHVYTLDFPITYRNASVLCLSECPCLHKTVYTVVSFLKMMKIRKYLPKRESICANVQRLSLKQKEGLILELVILLCRCFGISL